MRLRKRTKLPPRCSYCHADFGKEDIRCGCGGSHTECAMANGDCPACGEVTKPDMTWLEKNRDRLEMELERVEAELNTVEVTMEELEDTDKAGDSGQLRTQLEAGLERLGPSGTEFVGSTCSSCHRTYTRYPLMGTDTRCDGCWHDEVEEAEHPTVGSVSWPDVIFFAVFLVAIILGILMAVFQ